MQKKYFSHKKPSEKISKENSNLKKKRHRKADVIWTLEEEYIFFEIHKFFGNKWKKFSPFFPYKTTKELKNHFHTCIIKTVRRAINYNLNYDFIDILRCFYSIDEIITILNQSSLEKDIPKNSNSEKENSLSPQLDISNEIKKKKRDNKYNPKILRKKGKLTNGILINFKNYLFNDILMQRSDIQNFLSNYVKNEKLNIEQVHWLFGVIIKSKIVNKCKKLLSSYNFKDINIINNLLKYINENPSYIYLDDFYFNLC
jgi:arsenate reductase-like glutaredoxin family protein